MFLQIVFCFLVLIVGIDPVQGSACNDTLKDFKDIREMLPVYEDKKVKHCFFRLSEADENFAKTDAKTKEERTDAFFYWNKTAGTEKCKKYNAFLPRLKDNEIATFFRNEIYKIQSNMYSGVSMIGVKKVKKTNGFVEITWDDESTPKKIDMTKVHGNNESKFVYAHGSYTCNDVVDIAVASGTWFCSEPNEKTRKLEPFENRVFCQYTIPPTGATTSKPGGATTPKAGGGGGILKPTLKVILLATATLLLYQILPALVD